MGTASSDISPWASTAAITAPEARLALGAGWAKSPTSSILTETGVIEGASPAASLSGNNVLITPHQCVVEAAAGTYVCTSIATITVPIDTPLPSSGQSRIDLVVAQISGTDTNAIYQLTTVKGTAAASPAAPSVPANTVLLYRVPVTNAGPQTPVAAWAWTRAPGAARLVEDGDTRNGSYVGDQRKFKSGRLDVWTGTAWLTLITPAAWTEVDIPWSYFGAGATPGGTVNFGSTGRSKVRYKRAGNDLTVDYEAVWGGSGINGGAGNLSTVLPSGLVGAGSDRDQWIQAHLYVNDPVSGFQGDFAGMALVKSGSGGVVPFFPQNISTTRMFVHKIASVAATPGGGIPLIGGGYPQGGRVHCRGTIEVS